MKRGRIHFVIAWLCLISFGLDMGAHALGLVVCASADGDRLEWVCEKDERGVCLRSDVGADTPGQDAHDKLPPCEDRPIGDNHDPAHHLLVQPRPDGVLDLTLPPVMMAVPPASTFDAPLSLVHPRIDVRIRPPDTVARLRTIIMTI